MSLVVELSEEFVEQMAGGGAVAVAVVTTLAIMLAGWLIGGGGGKGPHPPTFASLLFLMWRWVMQMERPEDRVISADPA